VSFIASGQTPAPVQEAQAKPPLPEASEIVARYVRALGGRDAILRHASLRAVGTFSMPAQGIAGTVERFAARPDRFREKVSMAGVGDLQLGYDGTVGWMVTPMTGPMILTGKQLEQLRRDAEFDAALHNPAGYTALETVDRVEFEGRSAYKLRALRTNGDEDFEFFDVENGLLIGSIVTRESPMGTMKATNVMSDYRVFSGLQLPTRQVQRVLGTEQVVTITSVEFGGVDPSTFAPPDSIRVLAK
jgi:hypothetical protein